MEEQGVQESQEVSGLTQALVKLHDQQDMVVEGIKILARRVEALENRGPAGHTFTDRLGQVSEYHLQPGMARRWRRSQYFEDGKLVREDLDDIMTYDRQ